MKYLGRLLVLAFAVAGLGSVSVYAASNPDVVQQVQTVVTTTVDDIIPAPDPTPTPEVLPPSPQPDPTIAPPPPPVPSPTPAEQEFPVATPTATHVINAGNPKATTEPVAVPQTAVFIGATCDQPCSDVNTGGIKCIAPCTITFTANFQGGFDGVKPTFKWSDGGTGQTHVVTYTTAGTPHISVTAYEVYQGVTYKVGSANSIPITIQ